MAGELPANGFGVSFEAAGSSGHSRESGTPLLEELRTFQPYLMKRWRQIEEGRRKIELQEEVADIRMYLEIMSDSESDRMHGADQLRSYINKIHEMVYKNPVDLGRRERKVPPSTSTTSSAGTKEDDKKGTCTNEGRNLDETIPDADRKDDDLNDFTTDWPSPESSDLFDNWSSNKFRAKDRPIHQWKDGWDDGSATGSKAEPTVDDLSMYFERRPKPEEASASFERKPTFEAGSGRGHKPTWLEDPRTIPRPPPPRCPTPPMQQFHENHWLHEQPQPHYNQPDVVPPTCNNYYNNHSFRHDPPRHVDPMTQHSAYPITLSARPPTTFYVPGQGYITLPTNSYIVAGGSPILNVGQVPLPCQSEQMPLQNVPNPLFRPMNTFTHSRSAPVQSIEEITKAKARQCFLKKNENRKNHYRRPAKCTGKATKASTSTNEPNTSEPFLESYDEHDNFVESPPSPTHSPPPTVLPKPKKTSPVIPVSKKPTIQHDPKLQNIVNKIKAKHDQRGKEQVGPVQTIRKQLQVEGFYKLGQKEAVFEVNEKDSCSDAEEKEVKTQSSSKKVPKRPGPSELDGSQSKSMEILKKALISLVNEREANELLATTGKLEEFHKKLNDDVAAAKNARRAKGRGVTKQTPKSKKQQTKQGSRVSLNDFYSVWIDNMGFTDSSTSDGETSCKGRSISSKPKGRQTRSTVGKTPQGNPGLSNLLHDPLVPSSSSSSASEPTEGRTRSSKRKITNTKALVDNVERNNLAKKQLTKLPKKAVKRINSDAGNSPQKGRGRSRKIIVEEKEDDNEEADTDTMIIKRLETMFKPHISKEGREVVGPRDVIVNKGLGKIKLETDYENQVETVVKKCKKEELEQEIEEEDNFVQFQHLYPSLVMHENGNIYVPSNPELLHEEEATSHIDSAEKCNPNPSHDLSEEILDPQTNEGVQDEMLAIVVLEEDDIQIPERIDFTNEVPVEERVVQTEPFNETSIQPVSTNNEEDLIEVMTVEENDHIPGDDHDSDALLVEEYEDMEGIVITVHENIEQRNGIEAEDSQTATQFYKCTSWMKWYDIL